MQLTFSPTASASISSLREYARSATTSFSQLMNTAAESVMLRRKGQSQRVLHVDGAYTGKEMVRANEMPRRMSNPTAATLRNCQRDSVSRVAKIAQAILTPS